MLRCPKISDDIIVSDDPRLAAQLSCALAKRGEYLPVVDGPRLTRPDVEAEVIRRNNVVARAAAKRILIAGVSDESFALLSAKIHSRRIKRILQFEDLETLSSRRTLSGEPLVWGRGRIGTDLLKALRAHKQVVFSDFPSPVEELASESGHLVVCEEGKDLSEVIAANYAFSLGAGLILIPELPDEIAEAILQRFYGSDQNREMAQSRILDDLRSQIRALCKSIKVPTNGSLTFITGKIPYGFAFPEVPSTHLFKYPDLGISMVNGFAAEQENASGVGVAAFINPETVEAPELKSAEECLAPRGVFIREYRGPAATVQHISQMIEFFPYDLLMVATHCGDADGFRWTYEFTDTEGIARTLVVDLAIGISRTNDEEMLHVMQFTNFVSLDGVDWHDPHKEEKLYVGSAVWDYINRTGEHGDLKPTRKENIDRVTWSAALKMFDHNYIAIPRPLANGRTPIVINNACGSWHRLAETFTFGNARAYIGTLFPISTSEVDEVIGRLLQKEFHKPLATALWAAQRKVYKGTNRRPYAITGVFPQRLRGTIRDVPRMIYKRLFEACQEWRAFLESIDPANKKFKPTQEIIEYHEREIAHFSGMLKPRRRHHDAS
jgi:hypothetical protein